MAELGLIIGAITVNAGLMWLFLGGVKAHLDDSLAVLSQELAEVVLKLTQGVSAAAGEAPNPMQMMLMQLISNRMQQERGPDGQFKTIPIENQDR